MQSKRQLIALYLLQCYKIKILILKCMMSSLTLQNLILHINPLKQLKNLKNLNFKKS